MSNKQLAFDQKEIGSHQQHHGNSPTKLGICIIRENGIQTNVNMRVNRQAKIMYLKSKDKKK